MVHDVCVHSLVPCYALCQLACPTRHEPAVHTLPTVHPAVGRCPGALADALLRLAEGIRGARLAFIKDLRTRLLTLFSGDCPKSGTVASHPSLVPSPAFQACPAQR